ncbi:MAG: oxidoreductase [Elusimicrobia bacterium RIFOXYD12_FULL_66_9]|nr:MAG: oxidoreductase [Elusimicrobia bacterium RIFOXYD12_FULL_66_9]
MVIAEATAVEPRGRISPHDAGLWNDHQAEAWAPAARFVRSQGAVAAVQLAHAGRKASTAAPWDGGAPVPADQGGWTPVAPSPLPFGKDYPVPQELSAAEVAALPGLFAAAAGRALEAGFEAVELHFAHGYLVHQFLSPLTNRRGDAYGGGFDGRTRLAREITAAVRKAWPERLPLLARVSATDWVEGGWDLSQTVELARALKGAGVDFLDCSSGGIVPDAKVPAGPGFQVPFAQAVRREAGLPTGAVGLITEPAQAAEIVDSGKADAVLLGRQFLRDPRWPQRAAEALGVEGPWPKQYLRGRR